MKTLFSIGEMSKLNNVPIQTLRYYEKIGLFKPNYVNPKSKYRYYTIKQFFYLDIIKYLKYIGTPLNEMKKIIESNPETMYSFLDKQQIIIQEKIKKLQDSQTLINVRKSQLYEQQQLQSRELGVIYKRTIQERFILKVSCNHVTPHDNPDLYIRKLAGIIEMEGGVIDNHYGCIYPLKDYSHSQEINYDALYTTIIEEPKMRLPEDITFEIVPEGEYICIAFEWSVENYYKYYKQLFESINKMNILPRGSVFEVSLPINYASSGDENFITELHVLTSSYKPS
ncbi:helix-turn-helix domain-containing protein [Niallia taxi]|uniref:MerR family transcriptional regulator n=1 Tax=Niallia taxi TaxID=2499688 RepID=UPI002E1B12B6|nr:helix-turn-helix domain-containing protein [Niallia taxi]